MGRKCIICSEEAQYCIKGVNSDCYCEGCAVEQFGDVTYLIKVEEAAKQLKDAIDQLAEEGIDVGENSEDVVDQYAEEVEGKK